MPWQKQFHSEYNHIQVIGYFPASEEACRRFFRERVAAKMAEISNEPERMVAEAAGRYFLNC